MTTSPPKSFSSAETETYYNPQGRNSGGLRTPPRRIILNMTADDVQLNTCKIAWKPGMRRQRPPVDPEVQQTEDLLKTVRSILNKITPQKFDRLINQVTDLEINTEERLKGVVDLVFQKAIAEPNFACMYASMCCRLATNGTTNASLVENPGSTVKFRVLLLRCCQAEFQNDQEGDVEIQQKRSQLDSAASELVLTLHHPQHVLQMFFDWLSNKQVISANAFIKRKSCRDPEEQQGKIVALKSVSAFFICLQEAEEELTGH